MKKIATAILLFFLPLIMQAQFKVTLVNSNITSDDDSIYITGSFNGWEYNTNDKYELKSTGLNEKSVSLILDAGKHTYKFHRGSLGHIEMKFYNDQTIGEMPDRVIEISKDTVIHFTIDAWIDTMPYTPIYFLSKSLIKNVQSTQNLNIWKFKKGNNNNWSRVDLNTSDWENLKPTDINITFADQDGRIEGWFRTRIIFDSTFKDEPINMWVDSWAATETYIDGELVQSSGNLGANGEPFKEGRFKHVLPEDLILATGVDHILSVHFVDQLSGLPNREFKGPLKIEFADDLTMINLKEHITNEPIFTTIALTTGIIMTFLFWFLSVLITGEPNLARIATFSTLLTLLVISYWMDHNPSASYDAIVITHFLTNILIPTILIFSIYLLVKIFNRRVSRILKIIFIIIAFLGLLTLLNFSSPAPMIGLLLVIVTCVYYIITSFKSLRGAQWAVVAGISSLFAIVIFATIYFNFFNTRVNFLTISIFATALNLSFPLSLLIYTALRFKEMIKEVEFNASRVIKLSEEKKEQAIHQQKLLKEEVARQTVELRNSLDNLKSTQSSSSNLKNGFSW